MRAGSQAAQGDHQQQDDERSRDGDPDDDEQLVARG
jgi:hypothetical protein